MWREFPAASSTRGTEEPFLAAVISFSVASTDTNVSAIMDLGDITFSVQQSEEVFDVLVVPETINDGKVVNEVYLDRCPEIKKVVIPDTADEVMVIRCSGITEFSVSENNPYLSVVDGVLYDKEQKTLMCYPAGRTDTEFYIPDTVEVVGKCAFSGAENLECVYIPSSVRKIENSAFDAMKAKEFIFSEGVTDIEECAFYNCEELEKITFPASLERIDRPFEGCMNLKEIIILHRNINSDPTSSDIDPEKDNYFSLVADCKDVSVYVPDEDFEKYQRNILYLEDNGSLYKLSELQNDASIKMPGDLDGSGTIDVTDLSILSLYLLGDQKLSDEALKAADTDGDGSIALTDLATLRQFISKKIDKLGAAK